MVGFGMSAMWLGHESNSSAIDRAGLRSLPRYVGLESPNLPCAATAEKAKLGAGFIAKITAATHTLHPTTVRSQVATSRPCRPWLLYSSDAAGAPAGAVAFGPTPSTLACSMALSVSVWEGSSDAGSVDISGSCPGSGSTINSEAT
jgi:hypothetical protein